MSETYRKGIIEMINNIRCEKLLSSIYWFVKGTLKYDKKKVGADNE